MRMRDIHNYTHAEKKKKGANNILYIYMKIKELMMLQLL